MYLLNKQLDRDTPRFSADNRTRVIHEHTYPEASEMDYQAWLVQQAARLRAHRFAALDCEAIAEELEDMGRSERRAVEDHLKNLLLHLLKWSRQRSSVPEVGAIA